MCATESPIIKQQSLQINPIKSEKKPDREQNHYTGKQISPTKSKYSGASKGQLKE